ncbi:hypothetical protein K3495_g2617 [Podosphaera aphanis]|nr:hypothetical protein K3495_g2617 [Podosphaera aphanis]
MMSFQRIALRTRLDNEIIHDNSSNRVNDVVEQIYLNGLHISSDDEFELESLGSDSDIPNETTNAFDRFLQKLKAEWIDESQSVRFPYQRGFVLCARQQRRHRAHDNELAVHAKKHCQSMHNFLMSDESSMARDSVPANLNTSVQKRDKAIEDLEKMLSSKVNSLKDQILSRYRAVLAFLYSTKLQEKGVSREDVSLTVAKTFNEGRYFADRIRQREHSWIEERQIAESCRGKNSKRLLPWLNDEGVQLAVREWCSRKGEGITAYALAKAVGEYLNSTQREESIGVTSNNGFQNLSQDRRNDDSSRKIRSRTARNWLKKMGFNFTNI